MRPSEERDRATIADLVYASEKILEFISDSTESDFYSNSLVNSAVVRQITVLGEAVKRLSFFVRDSHPEIPWKDIAGMRDVLMHEYDDIDLGEVWRTCRTQVPALLHQLQKIQSDMGPSPKRLDIDPTP